MRGVLWTLGALCAAVAWNGAFAWMLADRGFSIKATSPIGLGMFVVHCASVWFALRLRRELRATGTGKTRARFDRPGTMFAYRMVGALALALSVAVPGLLIAWARPLFG